MANKWEYVVSPKIWDTDEELTDMLNFIHDALDLEFVGAVELGGWEHHVWRKPKAAPLLDQARFRTEIQGYIARSNRPPLKKAQKILKKWGKKPKASAR
jgi:hypothetical protein